MMKQKIKNKIQKLREQLENAEHEELVIFKRVKRGELVDFFAIPHNRHCIDMVYKCNDLLTSLVPKNGLKDFACNVIIDDYWDQCSSVQFKINHHYYCPVKKILQRELKLPDSIFGTYEPATYNNAGNGNPNYLSRAKKL